MKLLTVLISLPVTLVHDDLLHNNSYIIMYILRFWEVPALVLKLVEPAATYLTPPPNGQRECPEGHRFRHPHFQET